MKIGWYTHESTNRQKRFCLYDDPRLYDDRKPFLLIVCGMKENAVIALKLIMSIDMVVATENITTSANKWTRLKLMIWEHLLQSRTCKKRLNC